MVWNNLNFISYLHLIAECALCINYNLESMIHFKDFLDELVEIADDLSIDKVAEKLSISKVTVYSYLDEIRKND